MEIVKYAQQTRALLIRLLALVKWAGNSGSVKKCSVSPRACSTLDQGGGEFTVCDLGLCEIDLGNGCGQIDEGM